MTIDESDKIMEMSIAAQQAREILNLLIDRYYQRQPLIGAERDYFAAGYAQMATILSCVYDQISNIYTGLDALADGTHIDRAQR